MKAIAFLLALTCGTLAVAVPIWSDQVCDGFNENRFHSSKKYVYRYEATSTTGIQGVTDEKAELKIIAGVHVTGVSSCLFHLKVDEVSLLERSSPDKPFTRSRGNEQFVWDLKNNPLTFKSINGRVVNIKTKTAEPVYATNIKRGMLSALQLEFKEDGESTVNERDISGDCKTRYLRIIKDGKEDIYKVKNLTECTNRTKMDTFMHPVFYSTNSGKRTLLDCTSSCHYKVASKRIDSVECKETHLLRPFSYKSSGVMTTVIQKMVLEREDSFSSYSSKLADDSSQTSDLRFDFSGQEKLQQRFQRDNSSVEKILLDLVESNPVRVTSWMAPMAYFELVFQMKRLNLQAISDVWFKFYNCSSDSASKFCLTEQEQAKYNQTIVDALSQCDTEPCVAFIVQQIRKSLDTEYGMTSDMKQLMEGLAWVRNPTEKILDKVWTLLIEKKDLLPEKTITVLGSMIRKHCEVYPENCKKDPSNFKPPKAIEISRFFIDQLKNVELCKATPETVNSMIYALRAIGNSYFMEISPSELVSCAMKSNFKNISAVALQVLTDIEIDYKTRKGLKYMYEEYEQDPEIRMMAYLAWMKTPTKDDIKTVVETLEGEINTQVGSFVWSHLNSLNMSVEPTSGQRIGEMITEVLKETHKTLRHFNTTSKSSVWHKSVFNEKQNLGMSADSHVIYHPESLLPRHTHFNMTVDILGGAFPVLETSTRTEGLELIWDRLFGPTGHFPDEHIKYLVKTKDPIRSFNKRSVGSENDLEYLHDRVNMPWPTPSGLFSIKLFGNELALFGLKDLDWLAHDIPLLDWVDELRDLKEGVDKLYTKQLLFLHDSISIPTSIGLPLDLNLNGTAVGSIHVTAKGDLLSLFWGRTNIKLKANVKPSAAVSLSGMMSVNAFHSMVGIQLNSTMFTSTNISANLTYKEGEKFKFHYNVLEKPEETFNISSMLFKQVSSKKTPITGIKQRKTASVCISSIFNSTKYIGLDLCSNMSVPVSWDKEKTPFLPLTGPGNFSIKLYRTDNKLTTYKLEANKIQLSEYSNKTFVELSTPQSAHKRILLMNLTTLKRQGEYHWNITVGNHERNWTSLNFTGDKTSKMVELNFTYSNTSHMTSIYHMTKVYNKLKIVTNTSMFRGPIARPVTVMFLNATLNYSSKSVGRMLFNLTHQPLNFTWQVEAVHNFSELSSSISCIMKCGKRRSSLLNHKMLINITHINTTTEKGLLVDMKINDTRRMSVFGSKKVVKTKGHKLSTFFANCTFYNQTTLKRYTTSLNLTLAQNHTMKLNEMVLNVTYKNNSIALETSMKKFPERLFQTFMKKFPEQKSICFKGIYLNGTSWNRTDFTSCIAHLNGFVTKGMIWNLTSLNTTHKLNATWFVRPAFGILNYTCQNESLANFNVSYRKTYSSKFLGVNGSIGNWSLDLQHSYQDVVTPPNQRRSISITHKAKNRTEPFIYNTFNLTFLNSTYTVWKNMLLRVSLSKRTNETYTGVNKEDKRWQFVNKTVSWEAEIKNETEFLNISSLFDYQVMDRKSQNKLVSKHRMNHSLFWDKPSNFLNVSIDLNVTQDHTTNTKLGFNCSGTFDKGINMTANVNGSLLWRGFVSQKELISNLTLWNRTFMVETRTCDKTQSLFLNIGTWNQVNKTAFNGSISWHLNATTKKTSLNISLVNVNVTLLNTTFVNTSLYFTAFSLNDSHLNLSFVRRNKSELYNESSLEFRPGGKMLTEFNATSLKRVWKELNFKTFDIPRKLLNITVNFSSRGPNMKRTGKHLKMILESITRELTAWKFTQKNIAENLSNLTKRLVKVTSHSLPHITSDYSVYVKNNKFDIIKFWKTLTASIVNIPRNEIKSKDIAKELNQSLNTISESFNKTRVIGNLSEVLGNIALYITSTNTTVYLKNLTDDMTFYFKNLTNNITYYLRNASKDIGTWKFHSKAIDSRVKEIIPKVKDKVLYVLNETEMIVTEIHEKFRILREDVAFLSEHFLNETYPAVFNKSKDVYKEIKKLAGSTSLAGGIVHPSWLKFSEMLNISIFNTSIHSIHKYLISETSIEKVFPFLRHPNHITKVFHESVLDKSLEKVLNKSLEEALEMFNVTLRLPSWHVNKTHDKVTYLRDIIVMILNDTDNVMSSNSNKKLIEIVEFYINKTRNITTQTWNVTAFMMEGILNVSVPAQGRWEMLKVNVTNLYWNTSHTMPWARPLIRMWNKTMYSLVRNNTPEEQLKYWTPRFINFTLDKASEFTKYVNRSLTDEQTKTPRIKIAFSDEILNVSTIHRMESRPNFTKYFFDVSKHYLNFTTLIFNFTKKPKMFMDDVSNFSSNSSKNARKWTHLFFNETSKVFDVLESVANCSWANEKIHNLTKKCVEYSSKIMELDNWLLNKSMEMMFNKSNIPYYNTWKTMSRLYEMETHELALLFTPKNQTGLIINQRQFITFDKRSFQVPRFQKPGCSFLIARDFLEGQFTVLATQNSYIIITPESKIEIYKDGRIKANSGESHAVINDLPVQFDDLYAIRDGPFIRVISKERGFEFELEIERFIFGAYISGFYHNRTLGLLGTNNGEISDDWRSPLGKNSTQVENFLNSWLVGGDSECLVRRQILWRQCKRKESTRCKDLFESKDSPFKQCFNIIDPKAFLEACTRDVSSCETPEPELQKQKSNCSAPAAYVRACTKNDVVISMPSDCVDCKKETRYVVSIREVDIVVISSEGTNMKYVADKLPDLISSLKINLEDNKISPRFGLVGFSGNPPAHWPGHTHTLKGKFFGSDSEFTQAGSTLNFAPYDLNTNTSDGYMGIYHATKYPFRPGAKKIFLLVTDSRRVPDSPLTSDVVIEAMKNISAKLIVIGDYYFKGEMFGGDTERYRYYKKYPEGYIHKTIEKLPKEDDYVKVILKTKGAVFMVKRFEKKTTNKLFSEMIKNVVLKYSKGKSCFRCRCVPDEVGKGREVCKITSNFWCTWN